MTTVVVSEGRREAIIERLHKALGEGRQAYWVCPIIEESDVLEAQAAESTAESLSAALPRFNVGLIHGRMKPADKQAVMDRIRGAVDDRYDDVSTLDGVRVDRGDGWFLLRASGTQPLVRVTAEAREADRAEDIFGEATALLDSAR